MKRQILAAALVGVASLALLRPVSAQAQATQMPKADAQALWNHLQQQDYRKQFRLFPGKDKLYQGTEPHGALLTTYVNRTAYEALTGGAGEFPAGAIVVKENYTPDKTLAAITVMYKVSGYNPDHGDWFWLKRGADGAVEASGKVDGCIACHQKSTRDYIMTPVKR